MGYDIQRMQKLNKEYDKLLDECSFVGEIVLEENNLLDLCRDLKNYSQYLQDNKLNNIILVVCVNIAYYYYDETGFWVHFYDLCDLDTVYFTNAVIGENIERVLLNKNLIQYNRVGPFRYVGSILEQTGITRYNIPFFASIINQFISKYGMISIMNTTYARYIDMIKEIYCSRFLKQHLQDEAGWNFYCYVIRTIFYLENGVLDIHCIESFKGVHPMFWEEFLKHYKLCYRKKTKETRIRLFYPTLMLDEIQRRIYIKFPYDSYTIKLKNTLINSDGKIVYYLRNKDYLELNYTGTLTTRNLETYEWQINGWHPSKENYAYFNEKGEYVNKIDNLYKGKFYIITKYIDDRPVGDITRYIGNLNIDNLQGYEIYEVYINTLNNKSRQSKKVILNWENVKSILPINSYFDVFQEKIPNILIENTDLLEKSEELLLYDIGDGVKRIRDYYELQELKCDIKNKVYLAGEIWSESINRNRNHYHRSSLKFCVIPKCKLQLPVGLYGYNEPVQFISDSLYITYKNSMRIDKDAWIVESGELNLEGNINFKDISLNFNFLINRLKLLVNNSAQKYCFIDDVDDTLLIQIYAFPEVKFELYINDGHSMISLIDNCKIKQNGQFDFQISDIKNKLNNDTSTFYFGKLYFKYENKYIDLCFGILNFNNIIGNIENITSNNEQYILLKSIDDSVSEKIKQISTIYKNPMEATIYIKTDQYSPKIDELYAITLILSVMFDNLIIKDNNGEIFKVDKSNFENKEILETINWYYKAIESIQEGNKLTMKTLGDQYTELWIPKLIRWNEKINKLYKDLNYSSDTTKLFKEWNAEVSKLKKYGLKSNIAKRNNGNIITYAWIEYLKGNYENSIQILSKIENVTDVIIEDLKKVLKIIIYFKLIRLNAMKIQIENYKSNINEIGVIINAYSTAYDIIFEKEINYNYNLLTVIDLLLLREEDKEFLENLNIIIKKKVSSSLIEVDLLKNSNWMVNFIYYKLLKDNINYKVIIEERLKSQITEIPESPEKSQILNEILKY